MKKVLIAALAFVMFGSVTANAQTKKSAAKTAAPAATVTPAATPAPDAAPVATPADYNRTQLTAEELPAGLVAALTSDAYKEWKVANAYLVKGEKEYYEIEAVKGDEKALLKFDREGNII